MVQVVGTVLLVASHLCFVSLVAGTGLSRVQSSGNCLETNVSFICITTGEGGTQITFDGCSEQTGLSVLRHSRFQNGLQQEITCSTESDSGRITITNVTKSPTKQCFDSLTNETDYCYMTFIDITLYESSSCRVLQCSTVVNDTTYPYGNASIANEPPSPSQLNATLMLQDQTTVTVANITWMGETDNCTANKTLKYRVNTTNCGSCPASVDIDNNFIVCEGIAPGDQCNVSVQTIVPCNATSIPEMLPILGLVPSTEVPGTEETTMNMIAIIGGIGGGVGGLLLIVIAIAVLAVVVCVVINRSRSKSDSNGSQVKLKSVTETEKGNNKSEASVQVGQAESSLSENMKGDSYDHATHGPGFPKSLSRSGEESVKVFNEATPYSHIDIPKAHSTPRRKNSHPIPASSANDTANSQTIGIHAEMSSSPVPTLKTGDDAVDRRFANIEKKQREHDAKFTEQEKKINALNDQVEQLSDKVETLTQERKNLQKKLDQEERNHAQDQQRSNEKIEQLKTEKAEIEKELLETNQELNRTKAELKIIQEQRVASKRESATSFSATL